MSDPEQLAEAQEFVHTKANRAMTQLGYTGKPDIQFGDVWGHHKITEEVIVDLNSFGDKSYKPEWRVLAFAHEIQAHHAPARREPESAVWSKRWEKEHPAAGIFLNILADIAGNREIVTKVPDSHEGWQDFYASKLFPETDYQAPNDKGQSLPRHVQFLYAMLRETFVPDEQCVVAPEVRERLDALHDFKGSGQDLINYATQPFKTATEYLSRMDQMQLWRKGVWPEYLALYEEDLQDPNVQKQEPGQGQGQGSAQADQTPGEADSDPFAEHYQDYEENHHPGKPSEPKDDSTDSQAQNEQAEAAIQAILNRNPETADKDKTVDTIKPNPLHQPPQTAEQQRAAAVEAARAEAAGVEVDDYRQYQQELQKVLPLLQDMGQVFEQFINDRVTSKRQLMHRHPDGVVLDPDHLAQTVAQLRSGRTDDNEIPAFLEYGTKQTERELSGKLDFWLVVDTSTSMRGTKAQLAAQGSIAVLEGLDMFNQRVQEESRAQGFELDYDARTGVIVFNDSFQVPKELGLSLTMKERVAATKNIQAASGGTNTTPALDHIITYYQTDPAADRKKVVVVLSDGEDPQANSLASAMANLRNQGVLVYPIYLQSDVVDSQGVRIDDVSTLPEAFAQRVQDSLR